MPDARLLAGAATLIGASAVGLGMPAPTPEPPESGERASFDPPDESLPQPILRWLDVAHNGLVQRANTACITGTGRLRLGCSPWLPVSYQTSHQLGQAFAADLSATWYGRPYLRARDGYVDGRGVTVVRNQVAIGPGLDQGALPFLWSEAALVPATWTLPGLDLKAVADDRVLLQVRDDAPIAGPISATLKFDPVSGLPTSFAVPWRARGVDGTEGAPWQVDYLDWAGGDRGLTPTRIEVRWADDSRPWLRLRMRPPVLNVPVTAQLDELRSIIPS